MSGPARPTIPVRATIGMRKLARGEIAVVDPTDPFIAMCLKRRLLVPIVQPRSADETRTVLGS